MEISKGQEAYQGFCYRRCYRPLVSGSFFIVWHVRCGVITSDAFGWCYATQGVVGWAGVVWCYGENMKWVAGRVVIPAFCTLVWCYATHGFCTFGWWYATYGMVGEVGVWCRPLRLRTLLMLHNIWGGDTRCICTLGWCYASVPGCQNLAPQPMSEGFLPICKNWESKNVGITNDFDMAHVARHANYKGS